VELAAVDVDAGGADPAVVRGGGTTPRLRLRTFRWANGCADGVPPEPAPDIGAPREVIVEFPVKGWSFLAQFEVAGDTCERTQGVEHQTITKTRFGPRPVGFAGTYNVTLSGQGDGDVFAAFRWTTPTNRPLPLPEARLAVLADNDGRVDSYGVQLDIANLAGSPYQAEASITVEAADGQSLTFDAIREPREDLGPEGCAEIVGQLYWEGPDNKGNEGAVLGSPRYTYTIALTLDGTRHGAKAAWPDDQIPDNSRSYN
jgi:hypothetical protein